MPGITHCRLHRPTAALPIVDAQSDIGDRIPAASNQMHTIHCSGGAWGTWPMSATRYFLCHQNCGESWLGLIGLAGGRDGVAGPVGVSRVAPMPVDVSLSLFLEIVCVSDSPERTTMSLGMNRMPSVDASVKKAASVVASRVTAGGALLKVIIGIVSCNRRESEHAGIRAGVA